MKTLTVYTCVFGDYQGLLDPVREWSDCEFICFTDRHDLHSDIWSIRRVQLSGVSSIKASRKPKILPHQFLTHSEASLYIDANIRINKNPAQYFLPLLETASFWAPKHFARDCIFEEARECVILGRALASEAISEVRRYHDLKMPPNAGLSENNVLLRAHNNETVIRAMEMWWSLYEQGCGRDQLSLPVALRQARASIYYLDASSRNESDEAILTHHHHKRDVNRSLLERIVKKLEILARRLKYGTRSF